MKKFILLISAPGGAGKDSVSERLREQPEKFAFAVSYTDKPRRRDEVAGKTYNYISPEEFSAAIEAGEFLEWEKTRGEYRYGRKKKDFEGVLDSGKIPVMSIDVLGAEKFRKFGYDIISVFIVPPSKEEAKRRLLARGTDSPAEIDLRLERYDMEMSKKDGYDHIIINDDLKRAQNELLKIVKDELLKRGYKDKVRRTMKSLLIMLAAVTFAAGAALQAFSYFADQEIRQTEAEEAVADDTPEDQLPVAVEQTPAPAVIKATPPSNEAKKKVASEPPRYETPQSQPVVSTESNPDGSQTVVVSTGGSAAAESVTGLASIVVSVPQEIKYVDETGLYPDLGGMLKNYLETTLKWRSEITAMKQITVQDAGATGWAGQYQASYQVAANGQDIISASGSIILNVHYYKDSPYFQDYMKLVLSHEYGHHYTLYHKWVDWDLGASVRFPDSYYTLRPLSKELTATDYSKGWGNSEVEIMAEDYSFIYSGYSHHGMKDAHGYPGAGIRGWLDIIGDSSQLQVAVNNPPLISITAPTTAAVLSGTVSFTATASDDVAVSKVSFYQNDSLISEDTTAPYEASINTAAYPNGAYTLKAMASDGTLTAETAVAVTFGNNLTDTTNPTIAFLIPEASPYTWMSGDLGLRIKAEDDIKIEKVEIYINDTLALESIYAYFTATWQYASAGPGEYTVRAKAYDTSGNTAEVTVIIVKS